jgi:hypothetical protein
VQIKPINCAQCGDTFAIEEQWRTADEGMKANSPNENDHASLKGWSRRALNLGWMKSK